MALASLLRMLVQHDGDELAIVPEQPPSLARDGAPLRLFFPTVTETLHRQIVGPLLAPDRVAALERGEVVRFEHDSGAQGVFRVTLRGHPLPRATFQRGAAAVEAAAAEPVAAAAPPASAPVVVAATAVAAAPTAVGLSPALRQLLERALIEGASDVHLSEGEPPIWRIDGRLSVAPGFEALMVREALVQLLTGEDLARVDGGRGHDMAVGLPGGERLRVHVFRCDRGLAAAFRVLRRKPPSLAELGMPVPLDDLVDLPQGLVLVGGPTGCGKSTTLASLAQTALDRRRGLLTTLEDPIEYVFRADGRGSLVRQRQLGLHVRDFPTGLRDALREDPDVLLIGEMRDPESIALALAAAETGHLVLASIHVRSASSAITRIVDGCPDALRAQVRVQLAEALRAVIVQRLLPREDGKGRVVAAEVMRVTRSVAAHIREARDAQLPSVIQSGAAEGMIPLERSLRDLVRRGTISEEVARGACNERESLDAYLR